jgi:hypothetical protein
MNLPDVPGFRNIRRSLLIPQAIPGEADMSGYLQVILIGSSTALLAILIYRYQKERNARAFLVQAAALAVSILILWRMFRPSQQVISKGVGRHDLPLVILLYVFMLLGMMAQYLYTRFEQPKRLRKKFDLGLFAAPVFASPIVFIPLLAALQNADVDIENLDRVKVMVFLVAFENGFFWKEYCDHRRKLKQEGAG